jgi:hypothetical protein
MLHLLTSTKPSGLNYVNVSTYVLVEYTDVQIFIFNLATSFDSNYIRQTQHLQTKNCDSGARFSSLK